MVRQLFGYACIFLYVRAKLLELITTMDIQEIKSAVRIHEYIGQLDRLTKLSLKGSPIILGSPNRNIVYDIPISSKACSEYVEQLYEDISEHDLLLQALRSGWHYINSNQNIMPTTKEKYFQQLNSSHAFKKAKQLGYQLPENCLKKKQFCYGQYEAYSAIHELLQGRALGVWSPNSKSNFMHSYAEFYKTVKLITYQFIVPS